MSPLALSIVTANLILRGSFCHGTFLKATSASLARIDYSAGGSHCIQRWLPVVSLDVHYSRIVTSFVRPGWCRCRSSSMISVGIALERFSIGLICSHFF